jgi:hypothetical protein
MYLQVDQPNDKHSMFLFVVYRNTSERSCQTLICMSSMNFFDSWHDRLAMQHDKMTTRLMLASNFTWVVHVQFVIGQVMTSDEWVSFTMIFNMNNKWDIHVVCIFIWLRHIQPIQLYENEHLVVYRNMRQVVRVRLSVRLRSTNADLQRKTKTRIFIVHVSHETSIYFHIDYVLLHAIQ